MPQARGLNFFGLERVSVGDLNGLQDRLFTEVQRRLAALFSADRTKGSDANAQGGVVTGLQVGPFTGMTAPVSDGEALVYDAFAAGDDAPYRLARVDSSEGVPAQRSVTLAAALPGLNRIDAITVSPAVASLSGDTLMLLLKDAVLGQLGSAAKTKRQRAAASINVIGGVAAATPSCPPIPAGQVLLAYAYVPAGASTPSAVSDSRMLLNQHGQSLHGVLPGWRLTAPTQTGFSLLQGTAAFAGEVVRQGAGAPVAVADWRPFADGTGTTAAGLRYLYAHRRHAVSQVPSTGLSLVCSTVAPLGDGSPSARLYPQANPIAGLLGIGPEASCVGAFLWDGSTVQWAVGIGELHTGNEQHAGNESFATLTAGTIAGNPAVPGNPGFAGAPSFSGPATHSGAEVHSGQESFPAPTTPNAPLRAQDAAPFVIQAALSSVSAPYPIPQGAQQTQTMGLNGSPIYAYFVAPFAGRLSNLYVVTAGGASGSGQLTVNVLRQNPQSGTTPLLFATVACQGTGLVGSDTTHTGTFAAGDLIFFTIQNSAGSSYSGLLNVGASVMVTKL